MMQIILAPGTFVHYAQGDVSCWLGRLPSGELLLLNDNEMAFMGNSLETGCSVYSGTVLVLKRDEDGAWSYYRGQAWAKG